MYLAPVVIFGECDIQRIFQDKRGSEMVSSSRRRRSPGLMVVSAHERQPPIPMAFYCRAIMLKREDGLSRQYYQVLHDFCTLTVGILGDPKRQTDRECREARQRIWQLHQELPLFNQMLTTGSKLRLPYELQDIMELRQQTEPQVFVQTFLSTMRRVEAVLQAVLDGDPNVSLLRAEPVTGVRRLHPNASASGATSSLAS
jgi:hypothetical protein